MSDSLSAANAKGKRDSTASKSILREMEKEMARMGAMAHHRDFPDSLEFEFGQGVSNVFNSLCARIQKNFQDSYNLEDYGNDSMWKLFHTELHDKIIATMLGGSLDEVVSCLRYPHGNSLFYGFEALFSESSNWFNHYNEYRQILIRRYCDRLCQLAVSMGILKVDNPESINRSKNCFENIDTLLDRIEDKIGFSVSVPDVYQGYCGLKTKRGIYTDRVISGLYVAYKLSKMVPENVRKSLRILEIGPGLGWTTYFFHKAGFRNIHNVDLPISCLSASYFLGHALGENAVSLSKEFESSDIKIWCPKSFYTNKLNFDIAVNMDSLTEMGEQHASHYLHELKDRTSKFLSINHEVNSYCVRELLEKIPNAKIEYRMPHWLRRGYVEELISFKKEDIDG